MTKEVLLAIKGLQFDGSDEEAEVETIMPAEYYKKNGKHYIVYDEVNEGFSGVTKNIIKFQENELDVLKRGTVNVHMLFEEKKKNLTSYGTPFGHIVIGIDTLRIRMDEKEEQIRVNVDYNLEVNYQHLTDCCITMDIRPLHSAGQFLLEKRH